MAAHSAVHVFESLAPSDIGNFIGPGGSSLKNHVIMASSKQAETAGLGRQQMNIKVKPSEDGAKATAEIKSSSPDMVEIIIKNLKKHEAAFIRIKSSPPKPKVVKIVFKTLMEDHHQGKYVGRGGKNIVRVLKSCVDAIAEATDNKATSVRVNINDDHFLRKGSYYKLYTIKNDAPTENKVLITVSCIYDGHPGKIFSAVKPIIIDSVINVFPPEPESIESVEVDFLGMGSCTMNYKTHSTPTLEGMDDSIKEDTISEDKENTLESPGYTPPSPTYSPNSPTYTPLSPTYTPPE